MKFDFSKIEIETIGLMIASALLGGAAALVEGMATKAHMDHEIKREFNERFPETKKED